MLDITLLREKLDWVKERLKGKMQDLELLDEFPKIDEEFRKIVKIRDDKRSEQNKIAKEIGKLKREGKNPEELMFKAKKLSEEIKAIEKRVKEIEEKRKELLLKIPNIPHESVPDEDKIVKEGGIKREFKFNPIPAHQLCEMLDIVDFKRGAKIAGTHFPCFKGDGALLERALINFMLDFHRKKGYIEVLPPFLCNRKSMFSTGHLPKFEEDMYLIEEEDFFLNPTAEVPLINLHRDEKLNEEDLPLKYVGYTACFRREAGAYGADTRGLQRVHQFDKVELIKFTKPEDSFEELEKMLEDAEEIIKQLELPYRIVLLSKSEMSFSSAKTYDIEVWAPATGKWLEVSSVSNCTDFQSRRANIRLKRKDGRLEYVHTLNGSGVALPRTFIAIVENFQQSDGSVVVPDVLRPYMGGRDRVGAART